MDVSREIVVDLPAIELWELLTDGDELATWLGREVTFAARPGAEGVVVDDGAVRRLRVDGVEPARRLAFVWWPEDEPEQASRVEFTLDEGDDGTKLVVTESTPAAVPRPGAGESPGSEEPDGARACASVGGGRPQLLPARRQALEAGPPLLDRLVDLEWRCLSQRELVGSARR